MTDDAAPLEPLVQRTALAAAATIGAMLVVGFATGVAQEPLQWIRSGEEYARFLGTRPGTFRLFMGLDNLFIAFYSAHFVLLYLWVVRHGAARALAAFALAALVGTAALDLVENMHFLVMSWRVDGGFGVSETAAHAQVLESWLKFHVSYVGLFAFGFVFPRRTPIERLVGWSLRWLQLPLRVAIYVIGPVGGGPLVLARGLFFLGGLSANAYIFRPRA